MKDDSQQKGVPAGVRKREGLEFLAMLAPVCLIVALGLYAYLLMLERSTTSILSDGQGRIHGSLRLLAERSGKQWKVSWDSASDVLRQATSAELLIDDGSEHIRQSLSAAQILTGYTVHSPRTDDVVFQLEVFDSKGNMTSGTIRLLQYWRDGSRSQPLPSAVAICEVRPLPVRPGPDATAGDHPPCPLTTLDSSKPLAGVRILNNDTESGPANPLTGKADSPAIQLRPVRKPSPLGQAVRGVAPASTSPARQLERHSKLKRALGISPKTRRKLARFFRIKKPKPAIP